MITDAARELFAEHGFDGVTLADVAEAADVSPGTLFNYFPHKEDLVFSGMEDRQQELLGAIRDRPGDETVLEAFVRCVLQPQQTGGLLGLDDPRDRELLSTMSRIVAESPTLLARENQIFEHYTSALAHLIARETGATADDVERWVAANALVGVHRALLAYVRRQVLAGTEHKRIRRNLRAQRERAQELLERGLKDSLTPTTPKC